MHLEHVTGAIEHGHAVLCDKPFGRNADEAAAMRERAGEAGVLHFLNFEFRCNESWAKIKQLTDAGTIGTPAHLSWNFFGLAVSAAEVRRINDRDLAAGGSAPMGHTSSTSPAGCSTAR